MIVGVGVDVVDLTRFAERLAASPALRERLFTPAERGLPDRSLAGRFAVKEAVAKALGSPGDLSFAEVEVRRASSGAPEISTVGRVAARAAALGGTHWHLSISHDGPVAVAYVILEARVTPGHGCP